MVGNNYTIKDLKKALADHAEALCRELLPNGRSDGARWLAGNVQDESGRSLVVELIGPRAGLWKDFGDPSRKAGDLVDLIAAVRGLTLAQAFRWGLDFLQIRDVAPLENATKLTNIKKEPQQKPKESINLSWYAREYNIREPEEDVIHYFADRGISADTIRRYGVLEATNEKGSQIVFAYYDNDGYKFPLFLKFREINDKKFWTSRKADSYITLYGWQRVVQGATELILCEGEIDCLSFAEAGIAALSVPYGAGKEGKHDRWIDNDWDQLRLARKIVLAMDNDNAGQETNAYLISRLGADRCYVLRYPEGCKDANDCLRAGVNLRELLRNNITDGRPPELRTSTDYFLKGNSDFLREIRADEEKKIEQITGELLPWQSPKDPFRCRQGEVTIWYGAPSSGKSKATSQYMAYSLCQGNRWMLASVEMAPDTFIAHAVRQIYGPDYQCLEIENKERDAENEKLLTSISGNLWIYVQPQSYTIDDILDCLDFAHCRYGVDHFLLDNLSYLNIAYDDYAKQKEVMLKVVEYSKAYGIQSHIVCHTRKSNQSSNQSGVIVGDPIPSADDLIGSGGLRQLAANMLAVWRNRAKERCLAVCPNGLSENDFSERRNFERTKASYDAAVSSPDVRIIVHKSRGDATGQSSSADWHLSFNKVSLRMSEERGIDGYNQSYLQLARENLSKFGVEDEEELNFHVS